MVGVRNFMKLAIAFLLFAVIACDPYGFGFKKNPAWVLDQAFKAVQNMDHESLVEVTGKEALCVYGNAQGVSYLKEKLQVDSSELKLKPNLLTSKHFQLPEYVGYWSYLMERYVVEVYHKKSGEEILSAVIDCHYGTMIKKNDRMVNLSRDKYQVKECRLTKIIPSKFSAMKIPDRCEIFKITL